MFGTFAHADAQREATLRIEAWVRERFRLAAQDAVLVTEIACALPGCPPLETVIAFWQSGSAQRHHYKVFKPVQQVLAEDLPPWWMKDALLAPPDWDCNCC